MSRLNRLTSDVVSSVSFSRRYIIGKSRVILWKKRLKKMARLDKIVVKIYVIVFLRRPGPSLWIEERRRSWVRGP